MTHEQKTYLFAGILIAAIIVIGIALIVWDLKRNKNKIPTKEEIRAMEDEILADEGEILTMHAKVLDMACGVKSIGYQNHKQPKAVKFFIITFENDQGKSFSIPVAEGMYDGFDVGLSGTLTLVDGQLLSFEPDDSAESENSAT